jgi:hypothetical protein
MPDPILHSKDKKPYAVHLQRNVDEFGRLVDDSRSVQAKMGVGGDVYELNCRTVMTFLFGTCEAKTGGKSGRVREGSLYVYCQLQRSQQACNDFQTLVRVNQY